MMFILFQPFSGLVTIFAGISRSSGYIDGSNAKFSSPYGVAIASSGMIYVTDEQNHLIRKISTSGKVITKTIYSCQITLCCW